MPPSGSKGPMALPVELHGLADVRHQQQPLPSLANASQPLKFAGGEFGLDSGDMESSQSAGGQSSVETPMRFHPGSSTTNQWMADGQRLHPSSSASSSHPPPRSSVTGDRGNSNTGSANQPAFPATQKDPFKTRSPSNPPPTDPPRTSTSPNLTTRHYHSVASASPRSSNSSPRIAPLRAPESCAETQNTSSVETSSSSNERPRRLRLSREDGSRRASGAPLVDDEGTSLSGVDGLTGKRSNWDPLLAREPGAIRPNVDGGNEDVLMSDVAGSKAVDRTSGRVPVGRSPEPSFSGQSYPGDNKYESSKPSKSPVPRAIAITSLSPLTSAADIERHFSSFGPIEEIQIQHDHDAGTFLGISWIKFASGLPDHPAHPQVEPSSSKIPLGTIGGDEDCPGALAAREAIRQAIRDPARGTGMQVGFGTEASFVKVVLDPEGKVYRRAVKAELERRKALGESSRPARDKARTEESTRTQSNGQVAGLHTSSTHEALDKTPPKTSLKVPRKQSPELSMSASGENSTGPAADAPSKSGRGKKDPSKKTEKLSKKKRVEPAPAPADTVPHQSPAGTQGKHSQHAIYSHIKSEPRGSSAEPMVSVGQRANDHSNPQSHLQASGPRTPELTPNDVTMMAVSPHQSTFDVEDDPQRSRVLRELMLNGNDFLRIKNSSLPRSLKFGEAELRTWFEDAGVAGSIHKILHDSQGWYISFANPDAARRCRLVLERRPFLHHPIALLVQSAPTSDILTSPISPKKSPATSKKPRMPTTSLTQSLKRSPSHKATLSHDTTLENDTGDVSLGASDMHVEDLLGTGAAPVDDLINELTSSKPPSEPLESKDDVAADLLASVVGLEDASAPVAQANGAGVSKKNGANAVAKPKAKANRKRTLKEDGTADGPPKKKPRTSSKKASAKAGPAAMDVDKDLMDVVAVTNDESDVLDLAADVSRPDGRRALDPPPESNHEAHHAEEEVLDLEAALMGSDSANKAGSNATRVDEDLDVDAELLKAIGGEEDQPTSEVPHVSEVEAALSVARESPAGDRQLSAEPLASNGSKRPRESSPPPAATVPLESSEVLSTGRVRKKTKTPYAMATEQLAELDALIPLPPPTKSRKKSNKAKHPVDRDTAYHTSGKAKHSGNARTSKAKLLKPAERLTPTPQAVEENSVPSVEELGLAEPRLDLDTPSVAVSTPPTRRPVAFKKPQRPRIPTLEEATPASPPPPQTPEIAAQSDLVSTSFENSETSSPDPVALELATDDEELFFLKIGLAARRGDHSIPYVRREVPPPPVEATKSQLRIHRTGASRSEGYYKIPEALKSTYLPQRNRAMVLDEPNATRDNAEAAGLVPTTTAASASSRSNRINTRRLVQGMEQANKAMGDTQSTQLQFNQLRARKKQLIFSRSPIHDWGLYAMEAIPQGEMVIEYVGEVIRAQVADKREKWYEKVGIGSSYLFRVDEDSVVDATKRGNLGRLINHSCTPNCTAKIIVVNSQKKIVIYAKSSIEPGEEITYDYHFPLEQEKIPCLCGSSRCRGFLN